MTSLLLQREHLKRFYDRYGYGIQPVVRFLLVLCTMVSPNTSIGYMAKLESLSVTLPVYLASVSLPYGAIVFLAGYLMIAHVCAVSLKMALIAVMLILTIAMLYYEFKPGDNYPTVPTPLTFLLKILHVVPLLAGLGGGLASVTPAGYGMFLYYLLIYAKRNADIPTASNGSVDIIQKYSQIFKSILFSQTMMIMIVICAVSIIVVYLMRKLSMDYAWAVATVVGSATELLAIFVGDFVFGVSVSVGPIILGLILPAAIAVVFNFFALSVGYTRIEYAQSEGGDCYYYVRAVPKIAANTPGMRI